MTNNILYIELTRHLTIDNTNLKLELKQQSKQVRTVDKHVKSLCIH